MAFQTVGNPGLMRLMSHDLGLHGSRQKLGSIFGSFEEIIPAKIGDRKSKISKNTNDT